MDNDVEEKEEQAQKEEKTSNTTKRKGIRYLYLF